MRSIILGLITAGAMALPALAAEIPSKSAGDLEAMGFVGAGELAREACEGRVAVLRFNVAKDGGSYAGFVEAVEDHRAFVHGRGNSDVEFSTFAGGLDAEGGDAVFGSVIVYPSVQRQDEIRAARAADESAETQASFDAFVAKYQANTDGYETIGLCLNALTGE